MSETVSAVGYRREGNCAALACEVSCSRCGAIHSAGYINETVGYTSAVLFQADMEFTLTW